MKNKISIKRKLLIGFVALLILLVLAYVFLINKVSPIILGLSTAKIRSLTTASINSSVFSVMSERVEYEDLITVFSDNNGKINMIQADSVKINRLAKETARLSQEAINKIGEQGLDIPLGTLTGSAFFVGQGPVVHFKMLPVGSCDSRFISEFEEAGINQTRHKIYLEVTATVDVILPILSAEVVTSSQVLVCESILIGDVPETYLNFNESLLDFTPKV